MGKKGTLLMVVIIFNGEDKKNDKGTTEKPRDKTDTTTETTETTSTETPTTTPTTTPPTTTTPPPTTTTPTPTPTTTTRPGPYFVMVDKNKKLWYGSQIDKQFTETKITNVSEFKQLSNGKMIYINDKNDLFYTDSNIPDSFKDSGTKNVYKIEYSSILKRYIIITTYDYKLKHSTTFKDFVESGGSQVYDYSVLSNTKIVVVNMNDEIWYSKTAITTKSYFLKKNATNIKYAFVFSTGYQAIVNNDNQLWYSLNEADSFSPHTTAQNVKDMMYNEILKKYILVNNTGTLCYSSDITKPFKVTNASNVSWVSCIFIFDVDKIFIINDNKELWYSSGITIIKKEEKLPFSDTGARNVEKIMYCKNTKTYVIQNYNNQVWFSSTGKNFKQATNLSNVSSIHVI